MPAAIEKDIFRTIAYFSYFGYPLTQFEVWKWLYKPSASYKYVDVIGSLKNSSWLADRLERFNGFYGIRSKRFGGIERQCLVRHRRFINATEKYKKLKRVFRYLLKIPSIKGVAICNSLVFHHTREKSDIDLFVVTQPRKIWSTRFFAVLPLLIARQRPGEASNDPVDISFYVTENHLNLMDFKLEGEDPYLAYWVRSLIPVFGREDVFQLFVRHNAWAKVPLPNSRMPRQAKAFRRGTLWRFPRILPSESWMKFLQRKKFPKEILESANVDNRVVVSDDVLKFHKNDRREEIRDALEKRMNTL